jgi:Domain of unknown function (DUF4224)
MRIINMSEFLNSQDLYLLTGFARPTKQANWLKGMGIAHRTDGVRVIVAHRHVANWLEGRSAVNSNGPNWGAVK